MKISVHISFYLNSINNKKKLIDFNKILNNFSKLSKQTHIFVHTNEKKLNINKKKIKVIYHNLKNEDPLRLTWKSRKLIQKQRKNYDYYIYSEDDCVFTKKNFKYWVKYSKILEKYRYNPGFIRTELSPKTNQLWTVDLFHKLYRHINIKNRKYLVLDNPYFAMWIMDRKLLNNFIKSKFWDLNKWRGLNSFTKLYDREKSAVGWHGLNMNRFHATVVPLEKNKILNSCFFPHQPNKYVSERGRIHVSKKNIVEKKTIKFKKKILSKNMVLFNEFKNFLYLKLRFNFKNLKKNF